MTPSLTVLKEELDMLNDYLHFIFLQLLYMLIMNEFKNTLIYLNEQS